MRTALVSWSSVLLLGGLACRVLPGSRRFHGATTRVAYSTSPGLSFAPSRLAIRSPIAISVAATATDQRSLGKR